MTPWINELVCFGVLIACRAALGCLGGAADFS